MCVCVCVGVCVCVCARERAIKGTVSSKDMEKLPLVCHVGYMLNQIFANYRLVHPKCCKKWSKLTQKVIWRVKIFDRHGRRPILIRSICFLTTDVTVRNFAFVRRRSRAARPSTTTPPWTARSVESRGERSPELSEMQKISTISRTDVFRQVSIHWILLDFLYNKTRL